MEKMMNSLHRSYDKTARVLYISVGSPRPAISHHLPDGILIRTDKDTGEFVGLTVFDFTSAKEDAYETTLHSAAKIPEDLLSKLISALRTTAKPKR
jgi:hypothetical protein